MDLNTASRHQLKKEYGRHIGGAIYDLQDEGSIYMSSLVEVTDIGADYWLHEARTGVIRHIPEVGDVDLHTRLDDMSRAYTDVSNDNSTILKQLEEERHQTGQLQAQLNELQCRYDNQNKQLLDVSTRNGLLSGANINLTKELEKESGDSRDLQEQLKELHSRYDDRNRQLLDVTTRNGLLSDANINLTKQLEKESGASRDLQEQLKELHSRYDDRNRQLLDVTTRNGLLSDANINLTKELEKESGDSRDLQEQLKELHSHCDDHQKRQRENDGTMDNLVRILKERIHHLQDECARLQRDQLEPMNDEPSPSTHPVTRPVVSPSRCPSVVHPSRSGGHMLDCRPVSPSSSLMHVDIPQQRPVKSQNDIGYSIAILVYITDIIITKLTCAICGQTINILTSSLTSKTTTVFAIFIT